MGLIGKLFGGKEGGAKESAPASSSAPLSAQFRESEPDEDGRPSRGAKRREVVQVVLRETMRQHGIPSDWIDCRVLSVVSGAPAAEGAKPSVGVHVTFIVRNGEDRLLTYVHAFQSSFLRRMREFDARALDWILSVSWQFSGEAPAGETAMPEAAVWKQQAASPAAAPSPAALADAPDDEELQQDLRALFAIRDAVMQQPAPQAGDAPAFAPTQPGDALGLARKPKPAGG